MKQDLDHLIEAGVPRGMLTTTTSKIETYIEGMGQALEEVVDIHHDRLVSMEDSLEVMIGVVQTLKARVGSTIDIGDMYSTPTLWGSTAFIADDLSKVSQGLNTLNSEVVMPMQVSIDSLVTSASANEGRRERMVQAIQVLLGRINTVNDSVRDVRADLILVRAEQVRLPPSDPGAARDANDHLMDFIIDESWEDGCGDSLQERRQHGQLRSFG